MPWFFSITRSVLIDAKRKSKSHKEIFGADFDQIEAIGVQENESITSLSEPLRALSTSQQEAIRMRYVDEKTFEEIADRLKTSPANVRQMISRGVRQIKKFYRGTDGH